MLRPLDGQNLVPLLERDLVQRVKPIPFRYGNRGALVDNNYKLIAQDIKQSVFQLYDLANDPHEDHDLASDQPDVFNRLKTEFLQWNASVNDSVAGKDYPAGHVQDGEPESHSWTDDPRYEPYFDEWRKRPEYSNWLKRNTE